MAAIAAGGSAVVRFKGNQAAAKAAKQTADYNAKLAENEAIILATAEPYGFADVARKRIKSHVAK